MGGDSNIRWEMQVERSKVQSVQVIRCVQVTIPESEVMRHLGYAHKSAPSSATLNSLVSAVTDEADGLIDPQAVYGEIPAQLEDKGGVALPGGVLLSNPHAAKDWRGLERVALAVCTIGSRLESRVSELFTEGAHLRALTLDAAGSVAVSDVARQIDAMACQRAGERGMVAGMRFSPGSVGWSIIDQRIIFDLLPTKEITVELTDHLMMRPLKSISFVIGMGARVVRVKVRRPCFYCDKVHCPSREQGAEAHPAQ